MTVVRFIPAADLMSLCFRPGAELKRVLAALESGGLQYALCVDSEWRFLFGVTDGDVRRQLLEGRRLSETVVEPNARPVTVDSRSQSMSAEKILETHQIRHLPQIRADGTLEGLFVSLDSSPTPTARVSGVVMAGGRGKRLGSVTETIPKPLVHVGGKPMLERVLESFQAAGVERVTVTTHYLREQIQSFLDAIDLEGMEIATFYEDEPLGTAGGLREIMRAGDADYFAVSNSDVIHSMNLAGMVAHHLERQAAITIAVAEHEYIVPFGVLETYGGTVHNVTEKPRFSWPISAGVYVLSRQVNEVWGEERVIQMPDLISKSLEAGHKVVTYPVGTSWVDVGTPEALDLAKRGWPGS